MSGETVRMTRVGQVLLVLGIAFVVAAGAGVVGADTSGSPDTNTRAVINPGVDCTAQTTPAAPCATASNGATPPSTLAGAAEGTPVSLHVDGQAGMFFGVNAARMCKSGLNVVVSSTMNPSTGNCVGKPFVGANFQDSSRQDDGFMQVTAAPSNTSVDFTFRVGSGTATWTDSGGSHSITCDAANPCALWLWESVDTSISSSGNIFKHYDITYSGSGATTTIPSGTTTTTAPGATTTTAPSTGTTTTTVHATTTTTSPTGATTTTVHTTTTTTTPSGATTTTAPTAGTTTTTTPVSGLSVSPASAAPGASITITSGGWQPCGAASSTTTTTSSCPQVTVTLQSDPVTLGTLTPDPTGTVMGQFTIPMSVPAGGHTIVLSGTGANGQPLTQTIAFTVTAPSATAGGSTGNVGGAGSTGAPAGAAGSGAPGGLAQTGGRLQLFWIGLVMSATGGILILVARRRVRLPS